MSDTPVSDKVQAVIDAAREHVAASLSNTNIDETLATLANALDALDEEPAEA